jgi:glyoxylase-like metal-dependent hydrolase (beta-lactamase superfamily II)
MAAGFELERIHPSLAFWQTYDSAIKADLFSTAVTTKDGTFLVDPIALENAALDQLAHQSPIAGVIVTNSNHIRASKDYLSAFSVPLYAHCSSVIDRIPVHLVEITDGSQICDELEARTIDGAAPGEIALYHRSDGGTLIVGDALINFGPDGFTFLPQKYCGNAKEMKKSLLKLLPYNARRMLFAHGIPILSGATERLRQLLSIDPLIVPDP